MMTKRLTTLVRALAAEGNPEAVPQVQAYLKTTQPMYGIRAAERRKVLRSVLNDFPVESSEDLTVFVRECWAHDVRDVQYCAIDSAQRFIKRLCSPELFSQCDTMALTATWWDLVDPIAVNLIGFHLATDPGYQTTLTQWSHDPSVWIRRTSLLAHLKHKKDTDVAALEATILTLAPDKQFFIQKAIGWSLREYAKTDGHWVKRFLDEHREDLSGLACREASKHLN